MRQQRHFPRSPVPRHDGIEAHAIRSHVGDPLRARDLQVHADAAAEGEGAIDRHPLQLHLGSRQWRPEFRP